MRSNAPSPLELVLMALLAVAPGHAYGLASRLRQAGYDRAVAVNPGALHHALARLRGRGWAWAGPPRRTGGRPERVEHGLTPAGAAGLGEAMAAALKTPAEPPTPFQAALALAGDLDVEPALAALRERAWNLQRELRAGRERYRRMLAAGLPRRGLLDLEYSLLRQESELVWLRRLLEEIRSGELPWAAAR